MTEFTLRLTEREGVCFICVGRGWEYMIKKTQTEGLLTFSLLSTRACILCGGLGKYLYAVRT